MRLILLRAWCGVAGACLLPARSSAQAILPLSATVTQDEGLLKHVYSFQLPVGPQEFLGLTGKVGFTTTIDEFGEALISVNYLAGPNCAAVKDTAYASYTDPGFPALTRLAAFILKNPHAGVLTQVADIALSQGVRVPACIVLVLDGGGAWGPAHGSGQKVTMTSSLKMTYAPITPGENPSAIAYGLGGEFEFGPGKQSSANGLANILRVNPNAATAFALDSLFGSISASAFDGSSGEAVPHGAWGARVVTAFYPSAVCGAVFPVNTPTQGPLHVFPVPIDSTTLPGGGHVLRADDLPGTGVQSAQIAYYAPTWPVTLHPGDCLLTLFRASANGVIDLEDQSTAMLRPIGG